MYDQVRTCSHARRLSAIAPYLGQVHEQVLRRLDDGRGAADLAARLDQLDGVDELAALVALVAARVVVATQRADAFDEAVGEEAMTALAQQLIDAVARDAAVTLQRPEDVLSDPGGTRTNRGDIMGSTWHQM